MAADRETLEALHTQLTEAYAARLKEAKDDPEKPLTAAEATSIAKFLKDNNVTALLSKSPAGQGLLAGLPFAIEQEDAY